ncbi:MAG: GNAT family N-acetyltransferase [Myxococcota bacterium]
MTLRITSMSRNCLEPTIEVAVRAFGEETRADAVDDFEYSLTELKYRAHTLVALDSDVVVGAVQVVWGYLMPDTYTLAWLCVDPPRQKNGVGTLLMENAISYTSQRLLSGRVGTIYLSALFRHEFYERFGFTRGPKNHHGAPVMLMVVND